MVKVGFVPFCFPIGYWKVKSLIQASKKTQSTIQYKPYNSPQRGGELFIINLLCSTRLTTLGKPKQSSPTFQFKPYTTSQRGGKLFITVLNIIHDSWKTWTTQSTVQYKPHSSSQGSDKLFIIELDIIHNSYISS